MKWVSLLILHKKKSGWPENQKNIKKTKYVLTKYFVENNNKNHLKLKFNKISVLTSIFLHV